MIGILTNGLGGNHTDLMLGVYRLHVPVSYVPPERLPVSGGNGSSGGVGYVATQSFPIRDEEPEKHVQSRKFVFTIGCQYWVLDSEYIIIEREPLVINITPSPPTNPFKITLG